MILARRREREAGIMSLFGDATVGRRRRRRELRPPADPRPGVRQEAAARVREGDARALRVRPPADGRRAGAAALHRRDAHRAQGDARRRAAHRRRRRHRAGPQVHEARRPHGHVRARGSRRRASRSWSSRRRWPSTASCSTRTRSSASRAGSTCARTRRSSSRWRSPGPSSCSTAASRCGSGPSSARSPSRRSNRLKEILLEHPGDSPVFVHIEGQEKTTVLRLGDDHLVNDRNGLFAELRVLLGPDCIA